MVKKTQQPVFETVGGPFSNSDAQVLGTTLLQLEEEHGEVTKELVLNAAQDKSSPLHQHFLWDDTQAAKRYRLDQAGLMIRSIKIVVQVEGGETVTTRLLVNVEKPGGERVYRSTPVVLADPDLCAQAINAARDGLRSWRDKYNSNRKIFRQFRDEFADVFAAIDKL